MNLEKLSESGKLSFTDKANILTYQSGIKKLRKSLKLNTNKFGQKFGVSGRTVENWEQGQREPSRAVLMLMQNCLEFEKSIKI